jgi:hypothetical protein
MGGDVEMSLNRAEHFELLAAKASSNVLRCRYLSMARYWSILSSEGLNGAGSSRDNGAVPSSFSFRKPAPLERVL